MIRWLLWLLAGALLGGIVHLAAVLLLPRTATQDAYTRLTPTTPVNAVALLPQPTPQNAVLPFMDPAFASAVDDFLAREGAGLSAYVDELSERSPFRRGG